MEQIIQKIAILAFPILLAVTLHELAHGWVADKLGDPTARLLGRLTLNPIKHLDPVGTLAFIITGMIGWARPVPVNPLNLKDHRKGMMWVAMAGPVTNFFIAAISAIILRLIYKTSLPFDASISFIMTPLILMIHYSVIINIGLAVFNFLPIPPLDGGRIMAGLLPHGMAEAYSRIEPYGFIILVVLIFTDFIRLVVSPIVLSLVRLLLGGSF
ncbi:MAG: peptidase [Deltaproteobacteria bacterium GWC2_42_11]|nr:MAG: peptidase [Deltaproteobacteria bacterium GWC2_42_11]HBO84511.1 site-2 protease family protein [Deltaproteobacteria bacterium]